MTADFGQRAAALAAVGLLALVVALALSGRSEPASVRPALPAPAATSESDWYTAMAGVAANVRRRSPCGALERGTLGVLHPVLPCGAKLYLAFAGKRVLTQVVGRGPSAPGRQLDLTPALARRIGFRGVQPVRWTFAR